jgi:hypothetical protein
VQLLLRLERRAAPTLDWPYVPAEATDEMISAYVLRAAGGGVATVRGRSGDGALAVVAVSGPEDLLSGRQCSLEDEHWFVLPTECCGGGVCGVPVSAGVPALLQSAYFVATRALKVHARLAQSADELPAPTAVYLGQPWLLAQFSLLHGPPRSNFEARFPGSYPPGDYYSFHSRVEEAAVWGAWRQPPGRAYCVNALAAGGAEFDTAFERYAASGVVRVARFPGGRIILPGQAAGVGAGAGAEDQDAVLIGAPPGAPDVVVYERSHFCPLALHRVNQAALSDTAERRFVPGADASAWFK